MRKDDEILILRQIIYSYNNNYDGLGCGYYINTNMFAEIDFRRLEYLFDKWDNQGMTISRNNYDFWVNGDGIEMMRKVIEDNKRWKQ